VSSAPDGEHRAALIAILQLAYSGELAAAHAYDGHRDSVSAPAEKAEIERIRLQELDHRERVGALLTKLGAGPDGRRERKMALVGRTIGLLCRAGGWFVPMYGAAKLESGNIVEYEIAAFHARALGLADFVDDLLDMAEIEWDHELYFREKAASSVLWRFFPKWPVPAPRATIRERAASGKPPTDAA
jgi:hypothetical protein